MSKIDISNVESTGDVVVFEDERLRLEIKDDLALINGQPAIDRFVEEKIVPTSDHWITTSGSIDEDTKGKFTSCGCLMGLLYSQISGGSRNARAGYNAIDPYKEDPVAFIARQTGIPLESAIAMERGFTWGYLFDGQSKDHHALRFGMLVRQQSEAFMKKQRGLIRSHSQF